MHYFQSLCTHDGSRLARLLGNTSIKVTTVKPGGPLFRSGRSQSGLNSSCKIRHKRLIKSESYFRTLAFHSVTIITRPSCLHASQPFSSLTGYEVAEGLPLVKEDKIKVLKGSEINELEDLKERNSHLFTTVNELLPDER